MPRALEVHRNYYSGGSTLDAREHRFCIEATAYFRKRFVVKTIIPIRATDLYF